MDQKTISLITAAQEMLRIADATDCDEPMTEQFDPTNLWDGDYHIRLNDSLGEAQDTLREALRAFHTHVPHNSDVLQSVCVECQQPIVPVSPDSDAWILLSEEG